jgi:hypothetical protein
MSIELHRNPFGRLVMVDEQGQTHLGVTPVRAFPLSAPASGLSIVGADGHELVWVERIDDLSAAARALVQEELAVREFTPRIERLLEVSSFATPSQWRVLTDRGELRFVLKAEEDIRRLPAGALLIASAEGLQLSVADRFALDRASRKLLDRFL